MQHIESLYSELGKLKFVELQVTSEGNSLKKSAVIYEFWTHLPERLTFFFRDMFCFQLLSQYWNNFFSDMKGVLSAHRNIQKPM